MAMAIDSVSRESCRVAMYVKCSEDSERQKRKSPFSTTPLQFDAPLQWTPANICKFSNSFVRKPETQTH